MSVLFQSPGIELPEDMITEINVGFVYVVENDDTVPTLIYDGRQPDDLQLHINRTCRLIRFRYHATSETPVHLRFTGANIVPTHRDGKVYGDLRVVSITDDTIVIEDKQLHGGPDDPDVLVGNVTLFYFISSPGGPFVDRRSDPEVINTGRF